MTDSLLALGRAHRAACPTNTWCSDRVIWGFYCSLDTGGGGGKWREADRRRQLQTATHAGVMPNPKHKPRPITHSLIGPTRPVLSFLFRKEEGHPLPPLDPPPPPSDQSDHRGKTRNLPLGKSCWAIFGTQTFGSQTFPPPPVKHSSGANTAHSAHLHKFARAHSRPPLTRSLVASVYYFNFATGESVWDHPSDGKFRALFEKEKAKLEQEEEQPPPKKKGSKKKLGTGAAGLRHPVSLGAPLLHPPSASPQTALVHLGWGGRGAH